MKNRLTDSSRVCESDLTITIRLYYQFYLYIFHMFLFYFLKYPLSKLEEEKNMKRKFKTFVFWNQFKIASFELCKFFLLFIYSLNFLDKQTSIDVFCLF
jgi:hypothetical protein